MVSVSFLAVIARIHPEVWDVIGRQGPIGWGRVDSVALNPQPLPPKDPGNRLALGAAVMARRLVGMAFEADVRGEPAAEWVNEIIDEWCGTPWPRKWPYPWPGPRPDDGAAPEPWQVQEARAIGAVVFASYASRLGDGALRDVLARGAEKLSEVAEHG
jgi:hypothetical protein